MAGGHDELNSAGDPIHSGGAAIYRFGLTTSDDRATHDKAWLGT